MNHTVRLGFVLLLFTLTVSALMAGGDAFSGNFDGKGFDGKSGMEWVFKKDKDGAITVSVMIFEPTKAKGKKSLGRGPGKNVKVDGDKLEFEIDWFQAQSIKGPKGAKYVAEIKDNKLTVNWTAGDDKGELTATNRNPKAVAKKDGKKKEETKKPAAEKLYLSELIDAKGIPVQKGMVAKLGMVIVMGNKSKALDLKVTADTKFIVMDGDVTRTFDQKTVLEDPAIRAAFRERFVTIERQAGVALSVTTTPAKKK